MYSGNISDETYRTLSFLIHSGLVTAKQYVPWADAIILKGGAPDWVLDLSMKKEREPDFVQRTYSTSGEEIARPRTFLLNEGGLGSDEDYYAAFYLRSNPQFSSDFVRAESVSFEP